MHTVPPLSVSYTRVIVDAGIVAIIMRLNTLSDGTNVVDRLLVGPEARIPDQPLLDLGVVAAVQQKLVAGRVRIAGIIGITRGRIVQIAVHGQPLESTLVHDRLRTGDHQIVGVGVAGGPELAHAVRTRLALLAEPAHGAGAHFY